MTVHSPALGTSLTPKTPMMLRFKPQVPCLTFNRGATPLGTLHGGWALVRTTLETATVTRESSLWSLLLHGSSLLSNPGKGACDGWSLGHRSSPSRQGRLGKQVSIQALPLTKTWKTGDSPNRAWARTKDSVCLALTCGSWWNPMNSLFFSFRHIVWHVGS